MVYPNEPVFVPDPQGQNEDDGVILTDVIYTDDNSTYLVVLNASTMEELVERVPLLTLFRMDFMGVTWFGKDFCYFRIFEINMNIYAYLTDSQHPSHFPRQNHHHDQNRHMKECNGAFQRIEERIE